VRAFMRVRACVRACVRVRVCVCACLVLPEEANRHRMHLGSPVRKTGEGEGERE
jgi:hypothetical protein